jgi:hypothetical protein
MTRIFRSDVQHDSGIGALRRAERKHGNVTWVLIILWAYATPASTVAVFGSADYCEAAKVAVVHDIGEHPGMAYVLSADCYIQSGGGK